MKNPASHFQTMGRLIPLQWKHLPPQQKTGSCWLLLLLLLLQTSNSSDDSSVEKTTKQAPTNSGKKRKSSKKKAVVEPPPVGPQVAARIANLKADENETQVILVMSIGLKDENTERYLADLDSEPYSTVKQKNFSPTVPMMREEMNRRAPYHVMGQLKNKTLKRTQCLQWLRAHKIETRSTLPFSSKRKLAFTMMLLKTRKNEKPFHRRNHPLTGQQMSPTFALSTPLHMISLVLLLPSRIRHWIVPVWMPGTTRSDQRPGKK